MGGVPEAYSSRQVYVCVCVRVRVCACIVRNSWTRTIIFRIRIDFTSVYINVECMDGIERWSSSRRAEVPQHGMLGAYV